MFILQIGGWFIFSCILMSFIEHQVHRKLMHRRNFLSAHTASFKRVFEAHALVHHQHYAEIFSDEAVARGEDKDRKSTRLNSSHDQISYAVFCLKKKNTPNFPRNSLHDRDAPAILPLT